MNQKTEKALSELLEMEGRINKLRAELLKEKGYPLGRDPKGEWTIGFENLKYFAYKTIDTNANTVISGLSFTTDQQAQNKADGLNNLNLLIDAIHEENLKHEKSSDYTHAELYFNGKEISFFIFRKSAFTLPENLRLNNESSVSVIIKKLTEPVIKSALMYGVC